MPSKYYDPDATSSDNSSRASGYNDSAPVILGRKAQYLGTVPGGQGGYGQGAPVDEDRNHFYSQIYPEYQQRPSPGLDPQAQDSLALETLDPESVESPPAVTQSCGVGGDKGEMLNALESSASTSMRLGKGLPVVEGDDSEKSEHQDANAVNANPPSLKHRILSDNSSHDSTSTSDSEPELQHHRFASDITNSQAAKPPTPKKRQISVHNEAAEPPVGSNNAVDKASLGKEIVGVLQAQTAVLARVLDIISQ
ncbi:hypothetical protein BDR06DRAFT_1014996 [Suillus hirtellus]|nr:hypothetical protein BDR06DRAFT_1014996 [Suillus hirtellus]